MSDRLLYLSVVGGLMLLASLGLWWDQRRHRALGNWRLADHCLIGVALQWQSLATIRQRLIGHYRLNLSSGYVREALDHLMRVGLVEGRMLPPASARQTIDQRYQYRLTRAGRRCQRWPDPERDTALMI